MKKILFATKDIGAFKAAIPVAKLAREQGHSVIIFAEGKSIALWKEAGFELAFEGAEFPESYIVGFSAFKLVCRHAPDVVVTTTSSPCFIEEEMGYAAHERGIPLAFLNDFWRGFTRSTALPDLVCVVDEYDAHLAIAHYSAQSPKVVIAGNPSIGPEKVNSETYAMVKNNCGRNRTSIMYVGSEPLATTAELLLLIECLQMTSGEWRLIPRFHPKYDNKITPEGKFYRKVWEEMLSPFSDKIVSFPDQKTDDLAGVCDVVIAAHSLALIPAILSPEAVAVATIWTERSKFSLKAQTGLSRVPYNEMGLFQIKAPLDLREVPIPSLELQDKFLPYDPARALRAILGLAV